MAFFGLNTALRGLLSQQTALDTTAHNIANINTEGYSRQRAELVTTTPYTMPGLNAVNTGQLGTGVEVDSIMRLRDTYLDLNMRTQLSNQGAASMGTTMLSQLEGVLNEPGPNGLSSAFQNFFNALGQVSAHPENLSARAAFAHAGDELARQINDLAANFQSLLDQANVRIDDGIAEVNTITDEIAILNREIRDTVVAGRTANDLLDRRDMLMDELATKINYTYITDGTTQEVTISFGAVNLVDPTIAGGQLDLDRAAHVVPGFGGGTLTSGELYTNMDLYTNVIPAYQVDLDTMAGEIVARFNTLNAGGFDISVPPAAGGDLFDAAGITASTIAFNSLVLADPRLIAASSVSGETGNNTNVNLMLDERAALQGPLGNLSFEDFYLSKVTEIGTLMYQAGRNQGTQNAVIEALQQRRDEASGVSLDEEMANMLRFQHAYNASARLVTAFDEALDTLINRMGRVGL